MRIAICEDNEKDAQALRLALERYLTAGSLVAEIECFESGEDFLSAFEPGKYQIIFLDIYLQKDGLSGMQTGEKVHKADRDAAIILITVSEAHGIEGYRFAVYYILKPVTDDNLADAMEKCHSQLEQFAKTIELMVDRKPVTIRLRDIQSVEVKQRVCVLTVLGKELKTYLALDEICKKLGGFPFVQCHRSYIINLTHAADMTDNEFILNNRQLIPISRAFQAGAQQAFNDFIKAKLRREII